MIKLLIIEDEPAFAALLKSRLEREDITTQLAETLSEGLRLAETHDFDVILTDLYLRETNALDLLDQLPRIKPHLPVIVMTAQHTTETAIQTIKRGAYDYFAKPDALDLGEPSATSWPWVEELSDMIEAAAESKWLTDKVRLPNDTAFFEAQPGERMVGRSRSMQDVFKAIGRAAASDDSTVLIRGETGTGKDLAARALYGHSTRAAKPLVVVNSAAIPENLLESELFGHEKGAFTHANARRVGRFEQAQGGTIFLDEIGDMTMPLQQKLLRVLQEKTIERVGGKETIQVDVRVIAATHRNLELAVRENEFRSDLYHRLTVSLIHLPPLRERPEDIPELVDYFLVLHAARLGVRDPLITTEAKELLERQPWPGNVRQLRNVVRKALLLARGMAITPKVIEDALAQMAPPSPAIDQTFAEYVSQLLGQANRGERDKLLEAASETVEEELYSQVIRRTRGDQTRAARLLGVSRPTVIEKLKKFGLHPSGK
ncbi:MAG: Fis family transcriptional regulator [Verrucomicrobia bacterium]|nr:MAG: Fis family transcriptional regulator [Verrucomicrobiota bacterium]